MIWRIEIKEKQGSFDSLGAGIQKDIADLGFVVKEVKVVFVYLIEGDITLPQVERIAAELLTDRITQEYRVCPDTAGAGHEAGVSVVEIAYNPGVMDPVEASTLKGIRDLDIDGVTAVRTARQYRILGALIRKDIALIVDKVLSNKLIQHVVSRDSAGHPPTLSLPARLGSQVKVVTVDILSAGDRRLTELSRSGQLFLNINEMKAIRDYFRRIGRNPTDCELETIAQTWSEHCHHKTFRGDIRYTTNIDGKKKTRVIRNLLKSTIIKATQKLNKPWCVSVFHDNAGVIRFDQQNNICFKVETHNHPSALEPFGGANTGIGGVIRDILGTGLGARPVANTDIFCFAPPDYPAGQVPTGGLHPKRVMKGVVSGVRDYGNKMGIPTVNGAIVFDESFVGNPLVYCGDIGLIPRGKEHKKVQPGDLVVVVGGRTGRDGIHGATFSSGELTSESEVVSSGAVQIGDPIQEKKVLDVLMQARDRGLYSAITDCGAGGLSSAVGEMGEKLGARVDLDKVPLKYAGLSYMEIWISESQERMVMSVPPQNAEALLAVFAAENVEATVIGEFPGTGRLELFYHGRQVCDLDMNFLHTGIPRIVKEAVWVQPKPKDPKFSCPPDLTSSLLDVLGHYNVCSKEWVIRQYDHEVQGSGVIKPLTGPLCDGPSDASVITPVLGAKKGIAVANGINPNYGKIDPYWMAVACVDEAVRQIIAVGGTMQRIALLDNFCWGNPDKPDRLGGLVRAALGCYDAAIAYGTPFISGKDSLYNEYTQGRKSIAIPGTILISSIGIIDDVNRCVTMDLKEAGNLIYCLGFTSDEMGGSIYYETLGAVSTGVPRVVPRQAVKTFAALESAIAAGLVRAAHDCSEGGLAVALAEMAFAGGLGVTARLDAVPFKGKVTRDDMALFSESGSRFIVEVSPRNQRRFEKLFSGIPCACIGRVEASPEFIVYGLNQQVCLNTFISDLKQAWQEPLAW